MRNKGKKYFNVIMSPDIEVDKSVSEGEILDEIEGMLLRHKGKIQFFKIGFVETEQIDEIDEDR